MKRKTTFIVGTLSLSVMGFAGFGSAAQAASGFADRAAGEIVIEVVGSTSAAVDRAACTDRFCLFEHDEFTGSPYIKIALPSPGRCAGNLPSAYNNWASSMKNEYDRSVWLYDRANCSGTPGYTARANSQDKDLTNNGFDNKATSLAS
ncbi:peptidase inhibitor family I36 protein [Nonomuraea sp. NPDC050790]|uniref:peptidase inhibitor family I36 protein n=1 Tax=Nonomuraea sp. NPDC050790 TaxID=3364371 RepID=UPI0037BC1CD1